MVGVLLVTGACGSNSSDDEAGGTKAKQQTPLDAVLASSAKTAEAKSSKLAFSLLTQGVQGVPGGSITITGEGAFDYPGRQGAFTMNVPQLGQVEAVSTGSTIYQKFPPQLAARLGGKPWLKIDLNQAGQAAGIDFNSLSQASSGDPTQALQFLRGAGADMVEVGKEQVRGEAVTHYRGTVDMNKAAAAAPPEQQQTYQKLAQIYAQPLPVEVWIDGDGRLRKMTYAVDLSRLNLPPEATEGQKPTGNLNFTIELFDFGTPVSVTVPPADQVTDFAQLTAAAGRRR
jgi:hypothetical protein